MQAERPLGLCGFAAALAPAGAVRRGEGLLDREGSRELTAAARPEGGCARDESTGSTHRRQDRQPG